MLGIKNEARLGLAAMLAGTFVLSGCATAVPPHVVSARSAEAVPAGVQLVTLVGDAETAPAEVERFAGLLAPALEAKGVHKQGGAPYLLTIALSRRPADIGVTQAKDGKPAEIHWLSASRKTGLFARCKRERLQVSLIGRRENAPEIAYNGRGELDGCPGDAQAMGILATALASDFTRR